VLSTGTKLLKFEWMEQNKSESWAEVGAYIVNAQINQRPSRSKDNRSPYEVYYSKRSLNRAEYVLDPNLLKQATSEYALTAMNQVLHLVSERDQSIQVSMGTLTELIVDADGIFDDEMAILIAVQKKKLIDYITMEKECWITW
jgi:hypothetical protein